MAWWKSAQQEPRELNELLERKERILAWAHHQGGLIAATTVGLISTDAHEIKRIPWTHTLAAKWEAPLLTVSLAPDLSNLGWLIEEPGQLPVAVRDRVTAAVVVDRVRRFDDQEVRFIAHKSDIGIEWLTIAQDQDWADSAIGQASINAEVEALRSTFGI